MTCQIMAMSLPVAIYSVGYNTSEISGSSSDVKIMSSTRL